MSPPERCWLELGRVLTTKFGWDGAHTEAAISQLIGIGTMTDPVEKVSEITADPTDDRVLEAAASGGAHVIVSGDKHLLQLESWSGIRILRPAVFVEELR